jgi:DNA polymerase I-like protein with 3'-5' exonuclease and polymerase domains
MSKIIAVDFETYYTKEYSIKTLGVDAYINDPRFDPYLVAVYCEGEIEYVGHPKEFDWTKVEKRVLGAHNARFDETVFVRCQELGIIPKAVKPSKWICSADLSVFLSAPRSLAGAASALLGIKLDKSTRDKLAKLTYKQACERGLKDEVHEYALSDARTCYQLLDKYAKEWPALEQRISEENREEGRKGVRIDVEKLDASLNHIKQVLFDAGNKIPWDWADNKTPLSPKALRQQCRNEGIPCPKSMAKDDEECMEWEDLYGDKYPWVGAMRDWRRANMMLKKLETIKTRLKGDNFPFTIKYFGGHTGRFSGDGGFNMQNMPRGENMGVDLRSLFIPRKGKQFVIADLAQIEARIILWLADDTATLELVASGISVYEAHAIRTMKYDHKRGPLKKVDPDLYQLAKGRVLGLGYGCGPDKFRVLAKTMCNIDLTQAEAVRTVQDFRDTNPKIVALWAKLQRDCLWSRGSDYVIELPSGREMVYRSVKQTSDGTKAFLERGHGRQTHVYGGKLAENVTQAVARDVFIEGMDRLRKKGYKQVFHAHDEYVLETDLDVDLEEIRSLITQTPKWLEGCPLGADIQVADHYTK